MQRCRGHLKTGVYRQGHTILDIRVPRLPLWVLKPPSSTNFLLLRFVYLFSCFVRLFSWFVLPTSDCTSAFPPKMSTYGLSREIGIHSIVRILPIIQRITRVFVILFISKSSKPRTFSYPVWLKDKSAKLAEGSWNPNWTPSSSRFVRTVNFSGGLGWSLQLGRNHTHIGSNYYNEDERMKKVFSPVPLL